VPIRTAPGRGPATLRPCPSPSAGATGPGVRQYGHGNTAGRRSPAPKANRRSITDQLRAALHTLPPGVRTGNSNPGSPGTSAMNALLSAMPGVSRGLSWGTRTWSGAVGQPGAPQLTASPSWPANAGITCQVPWKIRSCSSHSTIARRTGSWRSASCSSVTWQGHIPAAAPRRCG